MAEDSQKKNLFVYNLKEVPPPFTKKGISMKIASSVLIEELKKSKVIAVAELAKYVEEKKDEYDRCKNSVAMEISISTDDDFSVEGKSNYKRVYPLPEGKDAYNFFMNIWNGLKMNFPEHRLYIKKNFEEYLLSSDIKEMMRHHMDFSFGGNQTVDVIFIEVPQIIIFGEYEVDLTC